MIPNSYLGSPILYHDHYSEDWVGQQLINVHTG